MTVPYFEAPAEASRRFTPADLVSACYEKDVWNVLFDEGSLPPEFFDLSSGFAGEMIQKLVNYGIRAAVVVPDVTGYSKPFRDFVLESNRSGPMRFFQDRESAITWLSNA